jgi:hypothetical protein
MMRKSSLAFSVTAAMLVSAVALVSGQATAQPPRNPPPARPSVAAGGGAASAAPQAGTGKYLMIPGMMALSNMTVQREIGITPDQFQKLKAVSDGFAAASQRLGKAFEQLEPDEKQKQGKSFGDQEAQAAQASQKKAEAILSPQQLQALKKISFDLAATRALVDPNLQKSIGLNAEQQQRLARVFDQAAQKMQQLQRDTAQQTMQLLDEEQAAALKQQMESQGRQQQQQQ